MRLPLAVVGTVLTFLLVTQTACSQPQRTARLLTSVAVDNGASRFAGDSARVTTISPNGDGFRDAAHVRFSVAAAAVVHVDVACEKPLAHVVHSATLRVGPGEHVFTWAPPAATEPRTYLVRITIGTQRYGAYRFLQAARPDNVVVRVQGVDAAFGHAGYRPGETAWLALATDAPAVDLQVLRSGPERVETRRSDELNGVPVGGVRHVDWLGRATRPGRIAVRVGDWPSGLYFAQLTASDGRVGYAPFVVAPRQLGEHRIAVVLPTNTWQAYNFTDQDGDGWGDTWYAAWAARTVRLGRPFEHRGVPQYFRRYDLPFLRWLDRHGIAVDYLSDADLDGAASGDRLARAYDFVVFPGHHEYVTAHEYDVVRRYRDLGGNLAWLSANNFFWKVVRHGPLLERVAQWRTLGKPEAALIGVQYRGNDEGTRRGAFVVRGAAAAPWLFDGTGLADGDSFGRFGIEIDATAPSSPPGTTVLAAIPHLYGPRFTAQMTYYETPRGAKVFAAGAFTLAGSARLPAVDRLLQNLFAHLERP